MHNHTFDLQTTVAVTNGVRDAFSKDELAELMAGAVAEAVRQAQDLEPRPDQAIELPINTPKGDLIFLLDLSQGRACVSFAYEESPRYPQPSAN